MTAWSSWAEDESKKQMIEVHHFRVWNQLTGDWVSPPSKRSAEAIAELKGEIIPDTGQMVFKAMLDSEGRYFPSKREQEDT
jgi:hypothetical protein